VLGSSSTVRMRTSVSLRVGDACDDSRTKD
jgi:hypothetical protein